MEHLASVSFSFVAMIPIALAVCGGVTTAQLGRAIASRVGEQGAIAGLYKAVRSRNSRAARDTWVAAFDLTAMFVVILLLIVANYGGATPIEIGLLVTATIVQGGLALMAYLRTRDIIEDRPEFGRQPGERHASRNVSGGHIVSAQTAEKQPMLRKQTLTRQERARLVGLGVERYKVLRPEIEESHRGEYIAISVKTGQFTTTQDDAKLKAFADSLSPDDFLWMTRVGSM